MSETALNITRESHKRVDLFTISGRIDSSNAGEFDTAVKSALGEGRYNLVLDLANVSYMSSAGLRVMVAALRECKKLPNNGDVRLSSPSDRVAEVLELAGLSEMFPTFDDALSAVGSF
ncbi:MAG: STAS domain-containing protein [Anaerolineae bacterium]|jgi:anti-sigma B factor antagonist